MSKSIREQINLAELFEKVPNRFLLTVAAAKRARQIDDGARPLIEVSISANRSLDIALLEIQLGKILVSIEDSSEEESILDEISDYLDSDILDTDLNDPKPDSPKKRKQAV
ncbi:MAG: DNA-directed RNA polymerase subunit omega [Candidatus Margulisiibacteriota bacterium]